MGLLCYYAGGLIRYRFSLAGFLNDITYWLTGWLAGKQDRQPGTVVAQHTFHMWHDGRVNHLTLFVVCAAEAG